MMVALFEIGYIQNVRTRQQESAVIDSTNLSTYILAQRKLDSIAVLTKSITDLQSKRKCSSECICSDGGLEPYGRNCGWGYYDCDSGIEPCDPLDYCCSIHDKCVTEYSQFDCGCHNSLLRCATCVYANELSPVIPRRGWVCNRTVIAIENIVSELKFLFPNCFPKKVLST